MRDPKTDEAKRHINQGVKIKMDEQGNILIKRLCKSNVYIKATNQEDNAIGSEILRHPQGALEHEKPGKVNKCFFQLLYASAVVTTLIQMNDFVFKCCSDSILSPLIKSSSV